MQDNYVGDIGDFGKYGMLNEIYNQSNGSITLGINWYKNTKEEDNNDGKHIDYLEATFKDRASYIQCFPELYAKLKHIIQNDRRCLEEIEKNQILPENTIFYSKPIPYLAPYYETREIERIDWFQNLLTHLMNADIIFVDPDNGIECASIKKTKIKAIKYVFKDEIKEYYLNGKSVVIYNHKNRKSNQEYNKKILGLKSLFQNECLIRVLRTRKKSTRDYIFLIQPSHENIINSTIDSLQKEPCNFMFEKYDLMYYD
ncbi:hypothetical protein [Methanolobus chelungpuianus]|uniref:Uncharacterized protein n=1 Tax=Methanolobus chelungpuianus TaxID=502115 RepID=A0AAE3KY77_9EURY|nr:hypothetical protein [Methanolobus chelungpuianus]MCQ6963486.1 hypothetical protein [Methanolobus chelungpuianus]